MSGQDSAETRAYRLDTSGGLSSETGQTKVFACNANRDLAERIAVNLGLSLGSSLMTTFKDGEIRGRLEETVRNCDCYIIQSTSPPVNNHLMELLIMTDAMRRASARSITAVVPYFGYARQDRKAKPREPITAKLVANLMVSAGITRIITMDLHAQQIQGFFDIPVDHLVGTPILMDHYKETFGDELSKMVIVSPDHGRIANSREFAKSMNMQMAIIDKRRPVAGEAEVMNIIGEVRDKAVIIADDMIDSAGTIASAAKALVENGGATEVYACCTHAVLSGPAIERIQNGHIKELVVLDTVDLPMEKRIPKIKILSTSRMFAQGIYNIQKGIPLSSIMLGNRYM